MEKLKNQKGLAQRPQSKAPDALAWLIIEMGGGEYVWTRAVEDQSAPIPEERTSELGRGN